MKEIKKYHAWSNWYHVQYLSDLSRNTYTKKKVFHINTEEDSHSIAKMAILFIMREILNIPEDYLWSEEYWIKKCKANPYSRKVALHPYFKFTYDEDKDIFVFTYVEPYDD